MKTLLAASVLTVAIATVAVTPVAIANASNGMLTLSGAHTFHHAQTDAKGICSATKYGNLFTIFSPQFFPWTLEILVRTPQALSNVNLASTQSVEVVVDTYLHNGGKPAYWGAGDPRFLSGSPAHLGTGHVTATQGDLSGTVTATLRPQTILGDGSASGTIHITASWRCSRYVVQRA